MPSVSENNSPPDFSGPFTPAPPFQCLQSLGADINHADLPFYEEFLKRQSLQGSFMQGPSGRVNFKKFISLNFNFLTKFTFFLATFRSIDIRF